MDLGAKRDAIVQAFRERERVLVAFSGGVDSSLVAKFAFDALGDGAMAVIADAESLSRREFVLAKSIASEIGIRLHVEPVSELSNDAYRQNPANRCFFCRSELATSLSPIAARLGFPVIADGVNVSDLGDVRPGIRAMDEAGFWHPLVDFDLRKAEVRRLARFLGLSCWDKPNNACLSSRIPHGTPITVPLLRQVEAAEDYLRDRGFRQVRVRHLGATAKVEVPREDLARLAAISDEVSAAFRRIGYGTTEIDPNGYRPGGLASAVPTT